VGAAPAAAARLGDPQGLARTHLLRGPQHPDDDLAEAVDGAPAALPALAGRAGARHDAGEPALLVPAAPGTYRSLPYSITVSTDLENLENLEKSGNFVKVDQNSGISRSIIQIIA